MAAEVVENPGLVGGERRQLTALFYDIVNSTALLSNTDPEDFAAAQRRVHREAAAAFREHGGRFDRMLGDGGCAYFGYPVATEDATEAAVSAALDLVGRCRNLGSRVLPTLQIRIGIATGEAVTSSVAGSGLPGEDEVIGLPPVLASRLQAEAPPDGIVVSDATHRLARAAFEFELIGTRALKGFNQPQKIWRLLGRREAIDRFASLRRPDSPMVARESELARCRSLWREVGHGGGRVVMVEGEAGIGKSRLVAELCSEIAATGGAVRTFPCLPRGNLRPLHPLREYLRAARADADGFQALPPVLRFLLSEDVAEGDRDRSPFAALTPDDLKRQAVSAAIDVVRSWTSVMPLLIVVEDAHWADTVTTAFLAGLAAAASGLKLLLLVTSRPTTVPLFDGGSTHTVSLAHLDLAAVSRIVERIWAPDVAPIDLSQFVLEKSNGVPLFVEELAYLLKERGGRFRSSLAAADEFLRDDGVANIRELLAARLQTLGEARWLVQVASVLGREFPYHLLAGVLEGDELATSLDEGLERLVAAGILNGVDGTERLSFRFRHVLIQEAGYESLLKGRRRELHGRVVRKVTEDRLVDLPDDLMAWHCGESGRLVDAATYGVRAAKACMQRSANLEAERLLLDAESHLRESEDAPAVQDAMLDLLATSGTVAVALHGPGSPAAGEIYDRGVALCQKSGPDARQKWFALYWGWWFTAPDFAVQKRRAATLIDDLDRATDPEVKLQAFHCAWATDFDAGNHRACLNHISAGLALYDGGRAVVSRMRFGGHDAMVCGLGERGQSSWFLGDAAGAVESMAEALSRAEATGHLGTLCHALDHAVLLRRYMRDFEGVQGLSARMRELADRHGLPGFRAKSMIFRGWAIGLTASAEAGLFEFERGLQLQRKIGTEEDYSIYCDMQAELLSLNGRPGEALGLLDTATDRAERVGPEFWLPELYRRRGVVRSLERGDPASGIPDVRRAAALAIAQGSVSLVKAAEADLARMSAA